MGQLSVARAEDEFRTFSPSGHAHSCIVISKTVQYTFFLIKPFPKHQMDVTRYQCGRKLAFPRDALRVVFKPDIVVDDNMCQHALELIGSEETAGTIHVSDNVLILHQ